MLPVSLKVSGDFFFSREMELKACIQAESELGIVSIFPPVERISKDLPYCQYIFYRHWVRHLFSIPPSDQSPLGVACEYRPGPERKEELPAQGCLFCLLCK